MSNPDATPTREDDTMSIPAPTQRIVASVRRIWRELNRARSRAVDLKTDVTEVERQDW
jgi:hypothetical protein